MARRDVMDGGGERGRLRDGGAMSLRQIGAELGSQQAPTVLRDLSRRRSGAGSSSVPPERPVTASDAPGAGNGTDGVDLSDYESVTTELQRLYTVMASGVRVPVNQTATHRATPC